jgi:hypothetical protein
MKKIEGRKSRDSGPPKGGIPLSLITSRGFAQRYRTWAVVAVRCKIANCSFQAVKGPQNKLE